MSSIQVALLLFCAGLICQCNANQGWGSPFTYLGCYRDQAVRDLQKLGPVAHMSANRCYHFCKRWGFKYFGMQYTYYCFCGNVHGMYGKVGDRECNMHCDGNPSEWCGGLWKNSVYEIHE